MIYVLGKMANKAGCKAIVLDGRMLLKHREIRDIPIKKMIAGLRLDSDDKGSQSRIARLVELNHIKKFADYVVISSRYVREPEKIVKIIDSVEQSEDGPGRI